MMRSRAYEGFYLLMGVNLLDTFTASVFPATRLACMHIFLVVAGIQAVLISYCLVSWLIDRCRRWFGGHSKVHQAKVGHAE